jgi:hypothetical protein
MPGVTPPWTITMLVSPALLLPAHAHDPRISKGGHRKVAGEWWCGERDFELYGRKPLRRALLGNAPFVRAFELVHVLPSFIESAMAGRNAR